MWLITSVNSTSWVEIDLFHGQFDKAISNITKQDPATGLVYTWYMAYTDSSGSIIARWMANTTDDGSNHVYEILNDGSGSQNWTVYLDYLPYATVGQPTSSGLFGAAGMEEMDDSPISGRLSDISTERRAIL